MLAGHESDQERAGAGRAIKMGRERRPTDTSDSYSYLSYSDIYNNVDELKKMILQCLTQPMAKL